MYTFTVEGINDMLFMVLSVILKHGIVVNSRGTTTTELHPVMVEVNDPTNRTLLYPGRGNNPFACLFECLWVLGSKKNNIGDLSLFLPRAKDYSDDGKTWRAGYPERLKGFGKKKIDQVRYVIEVLKADLYTRRAVISLWNPEKDTFGKDGNLVETLDCPCSNHLVFLVRDGKLDCTFTIRSNDAIYGMTGINFYEFSVLQELIASFLKVSVGKFYYVCNSLHLYEKHVDKAKELTKSAEMFGVIRHLCFGRFRFTDDDCLFHSWEEYRRCCKRLVKEVMWGTQAGVLIKSPESYSCCGSVFAQIDILLKAYLCVNNEKLSNYGFDEYCADTARLPVTDLKCACHFWMMKHFKKINPKDLLGAVDHCKKVSSC